FFFQAEDGIRDKLVTGVQTCALPIFPALVIEQVGVDRGVERGVVELEREVVASLLGAARPGGADLDPACVDAVAGRVLAGAVGRSEERRVGKGGRWGWPRACEREDCR